MKLKDGWRRIAGYTVFVENGYVIRGVRKRGIRSSPCYPYEPYRLGGWTSAQPLAKTFKSRIKNGTIRMI